MFCFLNDYSRMFTKKFELGSEIHKLEYIIFISLFELSSYDK